MKISEAELIEMGHRMDRVERILRHHEQNSDWIIREKFREDIDRLVAVALQQHRFKDEE